MIIHFLKNKFEFSISSYCYNFLVFLSHIKWCIYGKKIKNPKEIPIIINNYNRLFFLKKLIDSLNRRGYYNIYIIDNNSTYPPLLEYYDTCPFKIFRLEYNAGYLALWKTGLFKQFERSYYVYTDSDMQIETFCPDDFMQKFISIMQKYPFSQKVGFGIRIDDLPDCFENKKQVIEWENQYWKKEVCQGVYLAQIDTTFALYRPFNGGPANSRYETYRTGFPYLIKHLPWYINSSNLDEEEKYYINSITKSTHWSQKSPLSITSCLKDK